MKAIILGGTRGMGRSLARTMGAQGHSVCLLGRQPEELDKSAADIRTRSPDAEVSVAVCDLEQPQDFEAALDAADQALGQFDTVVITAGLFGTQDQLEADPALAHRVLSINFANTVMFCEAARKRLLARGGGTLCAFSSVAGDRGRKPVGLYGASKAGLSHYLESLDHKFHDQGLRVVCVKPGFVKTGMTAGLKPPPFAGEPDQVAAQVLAALQRGTPLVYAPSIWRLIMLVIRHLPRFVMRKIGF